LILALLFHNNQGKKFEFKPNLGWASALCAENCNWLGVYEQIRTEFQQKS
jgi:hypothetical protein